MYGSFQQAVVANCLAHRRFECCAPVGQSDSFLAEQAADRVLEGDQLRLQGCASPQQPALSLRFWRFDPDRSVFVDAHQISDAASIVAIVLVAETGLQAAAACRASMQITGQPCRCSPAKSQAALQPDSKPIRPMA